MNIMSNYTILIMTNDKIEKLFYALRLMERIGMTLSICPASANFAITAIFGKF